MIRKNKSMFEVIAESGRKMGKYKSKKEAVKRLKSIEYWKHKKG